MNMSRIRSSMTNIKKSVGRHAASLGKRHGQIKDGLNELDRHVETGRKVYNNITPTIKELTGDTVTDKVNKSLSNYDAIRKRVVTTHNDAVRHTSNVIGCLKKEGVSSGI